MEEPQKNVKRWASAEVASRSRALCTSSWVMAFRISSSP